MPYLLIAAATFGVMFLLDKGLTKLFRSRRQHRSGTAVRLKKHYGILSLALMTLKLWELIELALPMIVILALETVMMFCLARFVVFKIMGSDYDAAVLVSGFCGFGMGATPNAMANMQALTKKFGPAPQAFFIVPLVGSLFIDFFNGIIITLFMNGLALFG